MRQLHYLREELLQELRACSQTVSGRWGNRGQRSRINEISVPHMLWEEEGDRGEVIETCSLRKREG